MARVIWHFISLMQSFDRMALLCLSFCLVATFPGRRQSICLEAGCNNVQAWSCTSSQLCHDRNSSSGLYFGLLSLYVDVRSRNQRSKQSR